MKEFPFGITPDTSFFFSSRASQQALNTLLVATRAGEGFIKITGEVGTGKTLLCRQLLQSLGDDFQTAYIPNPHLTPLGLLQELADELGADTVELGQTTEMQYQHLLLKALRERLLNLAQNNKRVLVCLDEVQAMPIETLEALRLLTNLETEKQKLVQVVIFGQPELDAKLKHPSIRQLKQRITFDYHLGPLIGPELARYLDHRMAVAGYDGPRLFSAPATLILRWRTRGFPRLVNIVAHKALMCSYGRGKRSVGLREMNEAIEDTASLRLRMRSVALASLSIVVMSLLVLEIARAV
ncbi:MAG TPA: AAA family ATPase [Burkholderiaceae bacterium]|nr:AAA family ATPase [Burkholderiaceae bacterium]